MKHIFIVITGLLLLGSCTCNHEPEQPDGGFCAYDTELLPAVILRILPVDSTFCEVEFGIYYDDGVPLDTLLFSMEFDSLAHTAQFRQLQLSEGDTVVYEHKSITEGSCNPDLFRLTLQRYTP